MSEVAIGEGSIASSGTVAIGRDAFANASMGSIAIGGQPLKNARIVRRLGWVLIRFGFRLAQ